jgi:hypothetical protein
MLIFILREEYSRCKAFCWIYVSQKSFGSVTCPHFHNFLGGQKFLMLLEFSFDFCCLFYCSCFLCFKKSLPALKSLTLSLAFSFEAL